MPSCLSLLPLLASILGDGDGGCGSEALQMAVVILGKADLTPTVAERLPPSGSVSLGQLDTTARALGLSSVAMRWADRRLPVLPANHVAILRLYGPAITGNENGHFVVAVRTSSGHWRSVDYPRESAVLDAERLWKAWDGTALHLALSETDLDAVRKMTAPPWETPLRWLVFVSALAAASLALVIRRRSAG